MGAQTAGFTVSGPGVDKSYAEPGPGPALSFAITKAERSPVDATFYVRDADGEVVGYVERKGGETSIFRFGEAVA